jgi:hypothetical protein
MLKFSLALIFLSQMALAASSTILIENKSCDINRADIMKNSDGKYRVQICKSSTGHCFTVAGRSISEDEILKEIKFQERFFMANGVLMVLPIGTIGSAISKYQSLGLGFGNLMRRLTRLDNPWVKGGLTVGYGRKTYKEARIVTDADMASYEAVTRLAPQRTFRETPEGTMYILKRSDGTLTESMDQTVITKAWEAEEIKYYPIMEATLDKIRAGNQALVKQTDQKWTAIGTAKTIGSAIASVDSLEKATQLLDLKMMISDSRNNHSQVVKTCLDDVFATADKLFREVEIPDNNTMALEGFHSIIQGTQ